MVCIIKLLTICALAMAATVMAQTCPYNEIGVNPRYNNTYIVGQTKYYSHGLVGPNPRVFDFSSLTYGYVLNQTDPDDSMCDTENGPLTYYVNAKCNNQQTNYFVEYSLPTGTLNVGTISGVVLTLNSVINWYNILTVAIVGQDLSGLSRTRYCRTVSIEMCSIGYMIPSGGQALYGYIGPQDVNGPLFNYDWPTNFQIYDVSCNTYVDTQLTLQGLPNATYTYELYDGATLIPYDSPTRVTIVSSDPLTMKFIRDVPYPSYNYTLRVISDSTQAVFGFSFVREFQIQHWVLGDCPSFIGRYSLETFVYSSGSSGITIELPKPGGRETTYRQESVIKVYDSVYEFYLGTGAFNTYSKLHLDTQDGPVYGTDIPWPTTQFEFNLAGNLRTNFPIKQERLTMWWEVGFSDCPLAPPAFAPVIYHICGTEDPFPVVGAQLEWIHTFSEINSWDFRLQSELPWEAQCNQSNTFLSSTDLTTIAPASVTLLVMKDNEKPLGTLGANCTDWLMPCGAIIRNVQELNWNLGMPMTQPESSMSLFVCNFYWFERTICQMNKFTFSCVLTPITFTDIVSGAGTYYRFFSFSRQATALPLGEVLPLDGLEIATNIMCPLTKLQVHVVQQGTLNPGSDITPSTLQVVPTVLDTDFNLTKIINIDLTTPTVIELWFNASNMGAGNSRGMRAEIVVCGHEVVTPRLYGEKIMIYVLGSFQQIWTKEQAQGAFFDIVHPYVEPFVCGIEKVDLCTDAQCSSPSLILGEAGLDIFVDIDQILYLQINSAFTLKLYDFWIRGTSKGGQVQVQQIQLNNTSCDFQLAWPHNYGAEIKETVIITSGEQVVIGLDEFYNMFYNSKPLECPWIGMKTVIELPEYIKLDLSRGLVVDMNKATASNYVFDLYALSVTLNVSHPVNLTICGDEKVQPYEGISEIEIEWSSYADKFAISDKVWKTWMFSSVDACPPVSWKLWKSFVSPPSFDKFSITTQTDMYGLNPIRYSDEKKEIQLILQDVKKEVYDEFAMEYTTVSGQTGFKNFTVIFVYKVSQSTFVPKYDNDVKLNLQLASNKNETDSDLGLDFFAEKNDTTKKVGNLTILEGEPVTMEISKINREGNVTIKFNQPLIVPDFAKNATNSSILGNLDFHKDIMETFLIFGDPDDENKPSVDLDEFTLDVLEWTEDQMVVYVNFSDPTLISIGQQLDSIYFKMREPEMFRSKKTLVMPYSQQQKTVFPKPIPMQLPRGVAESELDAAAKKAMLAIVASQVVIAIFIKAAIKRMWQLFFFLQIVCALQIIQIRFPVHVDIMLSNIRLIIFFEILKPNILLPYLGVHITLEEILGMDKTELILTDPSLMSGDIKSVNSLQNLRLYLIILSVMGISMTLILFISLVVPPLTKRLRQLLSDTIDSTLYNGIIQSLMMSYLPQIIQVTGAIKLSWAQNNKRFRLESAINWPILAVYAYVPYNFYSVMQRNKLKVRDNADMKHRFGELFYEVLLPTGRLYDQSVFYSSVFIFRRFVFVMIPVIFFRKPGFQLVLQTILFLTYAIWMCEHKPLFKPVMRLKIFNEFMLLQLTYCMIIMTTLDDYYKLMNCGFLFLGIVALTVLINIYEVIRSFCAPAYARFVDPRINHTLKKLSKNTRDKIKARMDEIQNNETVLTEEMKEWLRKNSPKSSLLPENKNKPAEENQTDEKEEDKDKKNAYEDARRGGKFKFDGEPESESGEGASEEGESEEGESEQSEGEGEVANMDVFKKGEDHNTQVRKGGIDDAVIAMPAKFVAVNIFAMTKIDQVNNTNSIYNRNLRNLEPVDHSPILPQPDKTELKKLSDVWAIPVDEITAENLLPPDPHHFDIYPSIFPRNKFIRMNHRKLIYDLEKRMHDNLSVLPEEYTQFMKERAERQAIKKEQVTVNRRLMKTILGLQPHAQLDDFKIRVLRENNCDNGSLEYEIGITVYMMEYIHKITK